MEPNDNPSREALIKAATSLFGERGPAAVSTRQIANEAGVNSGLIHRHFRTKDALLREVMDRLVSDIASANDSERQDPESLFRFFLAAGEQTGYWRLLARSLLDGVDVRELQTEFPTMKRIQELFEELKRSGELDDAFDPRVISALLTCLGLGWLIFEPFLLVASGLDQEEPHDVSRAVRRTVFSMIERMR